MRTSPAFTLIAALALALGGCGPKPNATGGGLLQVGAVAPDLTGMTAQSSALRLSQVKGHPAVVYFYPKDETPGCTKEACAFRDSYTKFEAAGVQVFGVSRDSQTSHDEFRAAHQLPFAMVADQDGAVQKAYGVPSKLPGIAARVTFLVDANGKVARVWPDVDPVQHAAEVLTAVQGLH